MCFQLLQRWAVILLFDVTFARLNDEEEDIAYFIIKVNESHIMHNH